MTRNLTKMNALWLPILVILAVSGCADPEGSDWPERAVAGAACIESRDCASGLCFVASDAEGRSTGWADGLCAVVCGDNGVCPDGLRCIALSGEAWCVPACDGGADCRTGYVCNPDAGACLPDCRLDWDCGPQYQCRPDGVCGLPSPLGSA